MVLADDDRRYVAANGAACLLLRSREEDVLRLTIEDLVSPPNRPLIRPLWDSFLDEGTQKGRIELLMPDGALVEVEYSATANVEPGRHLAIWLFPPGPRDHPDRERAATGRLLTSREREILGMVAMGMGSPWIAASLGVAPSTVESHVRNCLEKLRARNRAHAIALGISAGEIALDLGVSPRRT
jgi:DNA-binding CsgD family transcriptional regulator